MKRIRTIALGAGLIGLVGLGILVADEYSGGSSPTHYATVTLQRARENLQDLRAAFHDRSLNSVDFQYRIRQIAARDKRGIQTGRDTRSSEHVIDVTGMDIPALRKKE